MRRQTAMGFRQQTRTVLMDEDNETPLHSALFRFIPLYSMEMSGPSWRCWTTVLISMLVAA